MFQPRFVVRTDPQTIQMILASQRAHREHISRSSWPLSDEQDKSFTTVLKVKLKLKEQNMFAHADASMVQSKNWKNHDKTRRSIARSIDITRPWSRDRDPSSSRSRSPSDRSTLSQRRSMSQSFVKKKKSRASCCFVSCYKLPIIIIIVFSVPSSTCDDGDQPSGREDE